MAKSSSRVTATPEGSPIGVWTNGAEELILHRSGPNIFRSLSGLPRSDQGLSDLLQERWILTDLSRENKLARERTTASMYPALNSGDFINVPMPRIPVPVQHEIGALVQHGWSLLGQSGSRLEAARRLLSDSLAREPRQRR